MLDTAPLFLRRHAVTKLSKSVELRGTRLPICHQRLKFVSFTMDAHEYQGIEQNPDKPSKVIEIWCDEGAQA
jgi:hypothetical protein